MESASVDCDMKRMREREQLNSTKTRWKSLIPRRWSRGIKEEKEERGRNHIKDTQPLSDVLQVAEAQAWLRRWKVQYCDERE